VRDWCLAQGLPAEKLVIIPPGVPPPRASDVSRSDLLRELNLPADARLIGVIGRLVPEKRVRDLVWAADLLRVLHDNLRMLIIGTGPLQTELEQYAGLASDLDHIRFLGERNDVWRIMPHLDVLWNGSDNRSISIAMLEAMAAGVPVIVSDVPVNRELVIDGETGYLISLGHRSGRADRARHTDRIFTDAAFAARLGTAALERAKSMFSLERMVQRYTHTYGDLSLMEDRSMPVSSSSSID
jgi:glycosyltransferase involved in cell wall biosynthesis